MWAERLHEFVTLFLVINPIAAIPVFLVLCGSLDTASQRKVAFAAVLISFAILVFFMFAGTFLLTQMNVPIRAFQISGGIVLFIVALEMLRAVDQPKPAVAQSPVSLAVYPLAVPKIAGPGAMLTITLLTDDDRADLPQRLATVGVLVAVMVITLVLLLASGPIARWIGTAVVSVISRVMGLLLAALAVSMVLAAVADWLSLPKL
jgi:multiple antibiotic resistance protein